MLSHGRSSLALTLLSLTTACVAPRSVIHSGRVTPQGEVRVGTEMVVNVPTGTAGALLEGLEGAVDSLTQKSDRLFEDNLNTASKAALAHSLDPLTSGLALSVRYGFLERFDAGYKYSFGAHALDARFQFLGKPGVPTRRGPSSGSGLAGSVGLQYSQQSFELPSLAGLDKLGKLFGFHMTRQDLLVPVALSIPFGADEKYGALGFGIVGGYTFLDYGLEPHDVVKEVNGVQEVVAKVTREQGFATYGAFLNVKGGYRYVYVGAGLAMYYQDYGTFQLLDQAAISLSGLTFVPTLNVEMRY